MAITLAAAATGNPAFRHACTIAVESVAAGGKISAALDMTGLFRPNFIWMLSNGEDRGMLDTTMTSLAESCEREATAATTGLLALVEPLCIAALGLVVMTTASAMMLPLFGISSLL